LENVTPTTDFENKAKSAFTNLLRVYQNKEQEKLDLSDLNPRSLPEAIKDLCIMIAQIIMFPLGIARLAGYDFAVSNSSSKQSAVDFTEYVASSIENALDQRLIN
jgi:hypothetical protein